MIGAAAWRLSFRSSPTVIAHLAVEKRKCEGDCFHSDASIHEWTRKRQAQITNLCGNQPLTTKVTGDSCARMKLDHARTFYTDEEFSHATLLPPKLLLNLI
jgi:hypothetical protein